MTSKTSITTYFSAYIAQYPDEVGRCETFAGYLSRTDGTGLYTRKNFDGHITTSAFIVNADREEILLLSHKSLNRWLQPGGHFEGDNSLMASALREAEEESGIPKEELKHFSVFENEHIPFDIDSHYIPANPKKLEDGHYHHDIRYLFLYSGDGKSIYNEEEATGMRWVKFTDLANDDTFGKMIVKIKRALNNKLVQ